jgi:hypothetical protein
MIAMLRKDFRLSLDAILPLAVVVIGFLAVAGLLLFAPHSLVPAEARIQSAGEAATIVYGCLCVGMLALPTWIMHAVIWGDRTHGASSFAHTLPRSRHSLLLSKAFAALLAGSLPGLVAIAIAPTWEQVIMVRGLVGVSSLAWLSVAIRSPMGADPALTSWAVVVAISVSFATAAAVRTRWRAMVAVHLAFLLLCVLVNSGVRLGDAIMGDGATWSRWTLDEASRQTTMWVLFVGCVLPGVVAALVLGVRSLARNLRHRTAKRPAIAMMGVAIAWTCLCAVLTPSVARAAVSALRSTNAASFQDVSDEQLVKVVQRWTGDGRVATRSSGLLAEAVRRATNLEGEHTSQALVDSVRDALRITDPVRARDQYMLTPAPRLHAALAWVSIAPRDPLALQALEIDLVTGRVDPPNLDARSETPLATLGIQIKAVRDQLSKQLAENRLAGNTDLARLALATLNASLAELERKLESDPTGQAGSLSDRERKEHRP